jgi:hypothetical protein
MAAECLARYCTPDLAESLLEFYRKTSYKPVADGQATDPGVSPSARTSLHQSASASASRPGQAAAAAAACHCRQCCLQSLPQPSMQQWSAHCNTHDISSASTALHISRGVTYALCTTFRFLHLACVQGPGLRSGGAFSCGCWGQLAISMPQTPAAFGTS